MKGLPKIIDNKRFSLLDIIKQLSPDFNSLSIATGYWNLPGTRLILDNLEKYKKIRLLIGREPLIPRHQINIPESDYPDKDFKFDLTNLPAEESFKKIVSKLKELIDKKILEVKVYKKSFLHAKCYIFGDYISDIGIGIIGSSNFTESGLTHNNDITNQILLGSGGYTEMFKVTAVDRKLKHTVSLDFYQAIQNLQKKINKDLKEEDKVDYDYIRQIMTPILRAFVVRRTRQGIMKEYGGLIIDGKESSFPTPDPEVKKYLFDPLVANQIKEIESKDIDIKKIYCLDADKIVEGTKDLKHPIRQIEKIKVKTYDCKEVSPISYVYKLLLMLGFIHYRWKMYQTKYYGKTREQRNPVRMIQRNGRINRIGSNFKDVYIYNISPEIQLDEYLRLVERLEGKINLIRNTIGTDTPVLDEEENPIEFTDTWKDIYSNDQVKRIKAFEEAEKESDLLLAEDDYVSDLKIFHEDESISEEYKTAIYNIPEGKWAQMPECTHHGEKRPDILLLSRLDSEKEKGVGYAFYSTGKEGQDFQAVTHLQALEWLKTNKENNKRILDKISLNKVDITKIVIEKTGSYIADEEIGAPIGQQNKVLEIMYKLHFDPEEIDIVRISFQTKNVLDNQKIRKITRQVVGMDKENKHDLEIINELVQIAKRSIKQQIIKDIVFNIYDFQSILHKEKIRGNSKYHYCFKTFGNTYSQELVDFIVRKIQSNPNYLSETRAWFKQNKLSGKKNKLKN